MEDESRPIVTQSNESSRFLAGRRDAPSSSRRYSIAWFYVLDFESYGGCRGGIYTCARLHFHLNHFWAEESDPYESLSFLDLFSERVRHYIRLYFAYLLTAIAEFFRKVSEEGVGCSEASTRGIRAGVVEDLREGGAYGFVFWVAGTFVRSAS